MAYSTPAGSRSSTWRADAARCLRQQLPVGHQGARLGPVGHHDGVGRLPVDHGEAQPWLGAGPPAGLRPAASSCRPGLRPEVGVPLRELAVEVGAGVALAPRLHPVRSVGLELEVDQGGYGLVGRGPVHVAAAEDREGQAGRGIGRGGRVGDPAAEALGVVRRLPVVGRADDHQRAFVRQFAGVVVEGAEGDGVAAVGPVLGDPGRNALGGAEVGAEEHHQRGVVPLPGPVLGAASVLGGLPVGRPRW